MFYYMLEVANLFLPLVFVSETIFVDSTHLAPVDSILILLTYIVLVQLSDGGSNTTKP